MCDFTGEKPINGYILQRLCNYYELTLFMDYHQKCLGLSAPPINQDAFNYGWGGFNLTCFCAGGHRF